MASLISLKNHKADCFTLEKRNQTVNFMSIVVIVFIESINQFGKFILLKLYSSNYIKVVLKVENHFLAFLLITPVFIVTQLTVMTSF